MKNYLKVGEVFVAPNAKSYELLKSKDKKDHKLAKRLMEYTDKAAKCFYNYKELVELRKQYSDVL